MSKSFNSLQTGKCIQSSGGWTFPVRHSLCFNSVQTGKCIQSQSVFNLMCVQYLFQFPSNGKVYSERPYFELSQAVALECQNQTRAARGFFYFKIYPKNPANPRVHWPKRDFLVKTARNPDTSCVLGQFKRYPHPMTESRLLRLLCWCIKYTLNSRECQIFFVFYWSVSIDISSRWGCSFAHPSLFFYEFWVLASL